MKLALWTSKRESQYTATLLKKLTESRGLQWVEPEQADILLVSVCDVDDLPKLKKARQVAGKRPLVMGGMEAFTGKPYLAWADYVWVGEGFEFFDTLANQGWSAVKKHQSMFSLEKQEATASSYINWKEVPLVKAGKVNHYFLAGRGCSRKCKFCYTSWAKKYQTAPQSLLDKVVGAMNDKPKKMKLHFISNDHLKLPDSNRLINPTIRIRDYLKDPDKYKSAISFHFGVERFSEQGRKEWGKPISNQDLTKVMKLLGEKGKSAHFFFMVGTPGCRQEMEEFLNTIPIESQGNPRMFMVMNYFDPTPHTPLQRYDVSQLEPLNTNEVYGEIVSRNKRWRTYPTRALSKVLWRTLFRRCDEKQAKKIGGPPKPQVTNEEYLNWIREAGLSEIIDGQQSELPWDNIRT